MSRNLILIVDDDPQWRTNLETILQKKGFDCGALPDYLSAISLLPLLRPSVLIMDLSEGHDDFVMDNWTGWKLARLALGQGVSTIVVTGHVQAHISSYAFREVGIFDLFDKAYLLEQKSRFINSIAEAVQLSQRRQISVLEDNRVVQVIHFEQIDGRSKLRIDEPYQARQNFMPPIRSSTLTLILQLISEGITNWENLPPHYISALEQDGMVRENRMGLMTQIGKKLYSALAYERIGSALEMVKQDARKNNHSLTLHLHFDEVSVDLVRYPWELIHDGRRFLAQGRMGLTRYIAYPEIAPPLNLAFPLRALMVVARPFGSPPLPTNEVTEIQSAVEDAGIANRFQFETLETPTTFRKLIERLNTARRVGKPFHIVVFDSHGDFGWQCPVCEDINDPEQANCETEACTGQQKEQQVYKGYLFLENKARYRVGIDADKLAIALADSGVQLVLLSACNSAKVHSRTLFHAMAPKLIEEGIPAVVAMQFPISSSETTRFSREFFLALGMSNKITEATVEDAVKDGRKQIMSTWFCPVLYIRTQKKGV